MLSLVSMKHALRLAGTRLSLPMRERGNQGPRAVNFVNFHGAAQ